MKQNKESAKLMTDYRSAWEDKAGHWGTSFNQRPTSTHETEEARLIEAPSLLEKKTAEKMWHVQGQSVQSGRPGWSPQDAWFESFRTEGPYGHGKPRQFQASVHWVTILAWLLPEAVKLPYCILCCLQTPEFTFPESPRARSPGSDILEQPSRTLDEWGINSLNSLA